VVARSLRAQPAPVLPHQLPHPPGAAGPLLFAVRPFPAARKPLKYSREPQDVVYDTGNKLLHLVCWPIKAAASSLRMGHLARRECRATREHRVVRSMLPARRAGRGAGRPGHYWADIPSVATRQRRERARSHGA
jgi:hypothetical protein